MTTSKPMSFSKHLNSLIEMGQMSDARILIMEGKLRELEELKSDRIAMARATILVVKPDIETRDQFYHEISLRGNYFLTADNNILFEQLTAKIDSAKKGIPSEEPSVPSPKAPPEPVAEEPKEEVKPRRGRRLSAASVHGNLPTQPVSPPAQEPVQESKPPDPPESPKPAEPIDKFAELMKSIGPASPKSDGSKDFVGSVQEIDWTNLNDEIKELLEKQQEVLDQQAEVLKQQSEDIAELKKQLKLILGIAVFSTIYQYKDTAKLRIEDLVKTSEPAFDQFMALLDK